MQQYWFIHYFRYMKKANKQKQHSYDTVSTQNIQEDQDELSSIISWGP
jgi:hypothetical protein